MKKIIIFLAIFINILYSFNVYSADDTILDNNIPTWVTSEWNGINFNIFEELDWEDDIKVWTNWEKSILELLHNIWKDLKTLIFLISWVYFFILVIKVLFASNTEEAVTNFKKWILWMSIWIIVMQISFYIVDVLYDREIWGNLAIDFSSYIIDPLIKVLETVSAFFFMFMAIFSFYTLITANGNEEKITTGRKTILYSIIGFVAIKLSSTVVGAVYWKSKCKESENVLNEILTPDWSACVPVNDISWIAKTVVDVINWMNGFVWIIIIILIIYSWVKIIFSNWDEEKISSAKKSIFYIFLWVLLLVMNYLILTFFIIPENTIN